MTDWSKFIRVLVTSFLLTSAGVYGFILLVDPYDSIAISLPLKREPISTNQRFAYPSLARKSDFNSAIIGTSTARLLKPKRLDRLTGEKWVNLSMNSATAYEQMEMLKLFLRHHPNAANIVVGIDDSWCRRGESLEKFTFRPFPPWMYDENPLNDFLYIFNDKSLENAVRLVEYWLGKRTAKYDATGYRDFTSDFGTYDAQIVAARLYNGEPSTTFTDDDLRPAPSADRASNFAALDYLVTTLQQVQSEPKITLLLMPFHAAYLHRSRELYTQCKGHLQEKLLNGPTVSVIDRMRIDSLTRRDANYWDSLHYTNDVAKTLEKQIMDHLP